MLMYGLSRYEGSSSSVPEEGLGDDEGLGY